jgi:hypothetical protein
MKLVALDRTVMAWIFQVSIYSFLMSSKIAVSGGYDGEQ